MKKVTGTLWFKSACTYVAATAPCLFRFEIYLKRKTVKKLNRTQKGEKLQFRTKLELCMEMLRSIQPYLPKENPVIILVDSWYASKDFIRFCLAQGWQLPCGLRSNLFGVQRGLRAQEPVSTCPTDEKRMFSPHVGENSRRLHTILGVPEERNPQGDKAGGRRYLLEEGTRGKTLCVLPLH